MKKIHASTFFSALAVFVCVLTMAIAPHGMAAAPEAEQKKMPNTKVDKQSQTVGEYIDDTIITTEVKSKILGEKGLSSLDISVKTLDGVVTLSGITDTAAHSELAVQVAKLVNGVKRVRNELQVDGKKTQSAGEYIDDSAITAAVKGAILQEKGLSSLDISVKTSGGVVTLSGTMDNTTRSQLAEQTAKQVNGVKRVVNELRVGVRP